MAAAEGSVSGEILGDTLNAEFVDLITYATQNNLEIFLDCPNFSVKKMR